VILEIKLILNIRIENLIKFSNALRHLMSRPKLILSQARETILSRENVQRECAERIILKTEFPNIQAFCIDLGVFMGADSNGDISFYLGCYQPW